MNLWWVFRGDCVMISTTSSSVVHGPGDELLHVAAGAAVSPGLPVPISQSDLTHCNTLGPGASALCDPGIPLPALPFVRLSPTRGGGSS